MAPDRVRRLRREEYERMVEAGVLDEDSRVELLGGWLVDMSPQGAAHAEVVRRLTRLLAAAVGERALLSVHLPLALGDDSEPEPDVALVPPGDHAREHPRSALLVVEVADTTLRKDRAAKAAIYAEAGIPEYWIVNLADAVVEVHREPRGGRYGHEERRRAGDVLTPLGLPGVSIAVSRILP